jgi:itaconyl-CoA hydratase
MLRKVGENEYQEEHGGDYEDFETGMTIKHWPGARFPKPTTPGSPC